MRSAGAKRVFVAACVGAGLIAGASPALAQGDYEANANEQILMQHSTNGGLSGSPVASRGYDAPDQYRLGLAALAAGKPHQAERDFDHAVNVDKTNASYLTMRGVARERGGNLNGAAVDLQKSLAMDPTQITALKEYGVVLAKQGKPDKAKAQLGLLKLQAEGCGDTCPDAAKLMDAVTAVEAAIAG